MDRFELTCGSVSHDHHISVQDRRLGLELTVYADKEVINTPSYLPKEIIDLEQSLYHLEKNSILNNGFILNKSKAAGLSYPTANLNIELITDAPLLVVYTGDYLDDTSELSDSSLSYPSCAVALEPQELYPMTGTTLTGPDKPFSRTILYRFT